MVQSLNSFDEIIELAKFLTTIRDVVPLDVIPDIINGEIDLFRHCCFASLDLVCLFVQKGTTMDNTSEELMLLRMQSLMRRLSADNMGVKTWPSETRSPSRAAFDIADLYPPMRCFFRASLESRHTFTAEICDHARLKKEIQDRG